VSPRGPGDERLADRGQRMGDLAWRVSILQTDRAPFRVKRFAQTVWTVPSPALLPIRGQYESDERAGQDQSFCKFQTLAAPEMPKGPLSPMAFNSQ
jgi:hypothetical protein